jgi:hypothetical protein
MFKVSRFCQLSAFGHPISSLTVSNLTISSWIHWHLIIRHGPCLVAPLLEQESPLFNDFETFIEEFNATFGDSNKKHMSNIKIRSFC